MCLDLEVEVRVVVETVWVEREGMGAEDGVEVEVFDSEAYPSSDETETEDDGVLSTTTSPTLDSSSSTPSSASESSSGAV